MFPLVDIPRNDCKNATHSNENNERNKILLFRNENTCIFMASPSE